MNVTQRFPVGTVYRTRGKHPQECTVTDFLVTRNLAGGVVKARYVSVHKFLGQDVVDVDVPETTIARGLVSLGAVAAQDKEAAS